MAATFHYGLLEQAFHLARRAKKRPTQADLRRSVSASYYALFHLLIDEATKRICRGNNHAPLRHHLARTFQHSNMRNVAEQFSRGQTPRFLCSVFSTNTLDERLVFVASSFWRCCAGKTAHRWGTVLRPMIVTRRWRAHALHSL